MSVASSDELSRLRHICEDYKERLRLMEIKFKEYLILEDKLK